MKDLKPCPFCGGEAEILTFWDFYKFSCKNADCTAHVADAPYVQHAEGVWYGSIDEARAAWNTRAYTTDELTLSGMYAHGLPIEDVRVFGMTLDEVRQMMKRDAERERTCELICHEVELPDSLKDADFEMYVYECSECGEAMFSDYNYCPNCGAKVVGE